MENGMEREQYIKKLSEAAKHTFWDYLGCSLESLSDNKVVVTLDIKPHHLNLMGIVHGGVTSSLLDNAMGIAVMAARPNDQCVTTNLNVHFVSPLKKGRLTVTAEIIHQSRKMMTTSGTVADEEGRLGTLATGTFRVIS